MEGSCLHDMHLGAGDVHLWWLFPEDVGPCDLYAPTLAVCRCVMECKEVAHSQLKTGAPLPTKPALPWVVACSTYAC